MLPHYINICFVVCSRYVHNNIFFSFAVDADLEQLPRKQALAENSKIENTALSQSLCEKSTSNLPQGTSSISDGDESGVPKAENSNGEEALSPDVPAEAQLAESEQATYASANNDLKGTKAYQEADVPGLYNLAMAIIDYRGHRVVAQVQSLISPSLTGFSKFVTSNIDWYRTVW